MSCRVLIHLLLSYDMDTLTHVAMGSISGELLAGRKLGKKAMLFGALAANIPDLDGIMNFIVSDAQSMLVHRGLSHSLFVAVLIGPLIGWLLSKLIKDQNKNTASWVLLVTVNILLHDLLDTCTMYGTGLLMPFSDYRFSWDNIFVADPVFTIPLFFAALFLVIGNKNSRKMALTGIAVSTTYMLFTFYAHGKAISKVEEAIGNNGSFSNEIIAVPTLFNSILWYVVVKQDNGYLAGYYSVFDRSLPHLYTIEKRNELENMIDEHNSLPYLKTFSKGYYCYRLKNGNVYFNDLRFGQINGWENNDSDFAFSFDLSQGADNKMAVQQGRVEGMKSDILKSMIKRMRGI